MPSTSDDMIALMKEWFPGASCPDSDVLQFLESRGWIENAGFLRPPVSAYSNEIDWLCVKYLIEDWDYDIDRAFCHDYRSKHR